MEADVAGPHRNLEGKIPIVLGTIPLADYQSQPDPSMAPTKPVTPVSPPSGAGGALGWNMSDSTGTALYPNIRKYIYQLFHVCQQIGPCFQRYFL